jgi:hypothetical protein
MKRWQKAVLGTLSGLAVLSGAAYAFRTDLALAFVHWRSGIPIAANRPVPWQAGPAQAAAPPGERAPNIVFILFDDLGMNDLSTFGGGIAGGRVPTPNIDRLATEGHAVLMFSSEMEELLGMSDRILVMREGRQMGIIDSARATQEGIMAVATGQSEAA